MILKLHSNYFRKFMDSPDKQPAPATATWKYEYVSVVDKDGTWALETTQKIPQNGYHIEDVAKKDRQRDIFRKLLCVMYNRPYIISNADECHSLIRMADFYCALPIPSATCTPALLESPMFQSDPDDELVGIFKNEAPRLIFDAKKLQHPVLFRECFVHIIGNFRDESSMSEFLEDLNADKDVWSLIINAYIDLTEQTLETMKSLILFQNGPGNSWFRTGDLDETFSTEENAMAFREWKKRLNRETDHRKGILGGNLELQLGKLLKNNLVLDQTSCGSGERPYTWSFLSTQIANEYMPWDHRG